MDSWWRSRWSIVSTFSIKVFNSFFSSKISFYFCFQSYFIPSNFPLMKLIDLLTSPCNYHLESELLLLSKKVQKSCLPFSPNFAISCIEQQHNVGILILLQKHLSPYFFCCFHLIYHLNHISVANVFNARMLKFSTVQ